MKLRPGLIFLAVTIFSVLIYFFYFNSTESRTKYPTWLETSAAAWEKPNLASTVTADASLWANSSTDSNMKPPWATGNSDTKDTTQEELTKRWINRTVNDGIKATSITSSAPTGIKSILVRKNNGLTAELPIMEFFKKLHDDMYLGYLRAKDYTDGTKADIMADPLLVKYNESFKFRNASNNFEIAGGNWIGEGGWVVKMQPGQPGDNWKMSRT